MTNSQPQNKARPPDVLTPAPVWIVTGDRDLARQASEAIRPLTGSVGIYDPDLMDEVMLGRARTEPPTLIILDVGRDMDRGVRAIQRLKRLRITAPIIAITQDISREFGAKIISQGIRYYFPRDFDADELREVADSYLKVGQQGK